MGQRGSRRDRRGTKRRRDASARRQSHLVIARRRRRRGNPSTEGAAGARADHGLLRYARNDDGRRSRHFSPPLAPGSRPGQVSGLGGGGGATTGAYGSEPARSAARPTGRRALWRESQGGRTSAARRLRAPTNRLAEGRGRFKAEFGPKHSTAKVQQAPCNKLSCAICC